MQRKPKLSIIIVKYKAEKEFRECVASIKKSLPENDKNKLSYEIIVVDNNKKNVGYGAGINLGVKKAKGEFLLIANPDTKWGKGVISKLVSYYEKHDRCGILGPDLIDKSGNLYDFVGTGELTPLSSIFGLSIIHRIWPSNPIAKRYWIKREENKQVKEVDVVPGAAFLVSRKIFEKIGGFDENFFLYFEESDFCRRIKDLGYRNYILPGTKVTHLWGMSTKSNPKKDFYFRESRKYYFKKYYGWFWSNLVEAILNFGKWELIFSVIFILALFLRVYRFVPNLRLDGEMGDNYLDMKNILGGTRTALLGPPTSHPWLYFGPLFYWLAIPFILISNFNPIGPGCFILIASLVTIFLNYYVISRLFNKKTAIISSFLITISPLWLALTRGARFFSLVTLFFYPFLYFLVKSIEGKKERFFVVGLLLGLMLNFHLTPIVLIPAILILDFIKRRKKVVKDMIKMAIGILIPNLPFLFYNLTHGMEMVKQFLIWIPYRILGFLGLYPKNTVSGFILSQNISSLYKFITSSILPVDNFVGVIVFVLVVVGLIVMLLNYKKDFRWFTLAVIFLLGYIGVFVHGDPPPHYYLPLYAIPILIFSNIVVLLLKTKVGRVAVGLIFLAFVFLDFRYYFSEKWFYLPTDKLVKDQTVPYGLQLQVAKEIVDNANGRRFNLKRVGVNDQFSQNYSQNYRYLMWWMGNEPQDGQQSLTYTIIENVPDVIVVKSTK